MEYCVNLLVSVPIEAVEDATVEELIYQAEKRWNGSPPQAFTKRAK